MANYFIGFISGLCFVRVFTIIREYRYRRMVKKYVKVCSSKEELSQAIDEILKDIKEEVAENGRTDNK